MNGVDTNVLLRFIVRDDERQFESAATFLAAKTPDDQAYVSLVVIAELIWALRRRYGYSQDAIVVNLGRLVASRELAFEDEGFLAALLGDPDSIKADIADYLIARTASNAGCMKTVTFDKRAAKAVPGMELLA
jgi:predicted nucleic-acid-binding protein